MLPFHFEPHRNKLQTNSSSESE